MQTTGRLWVQDERYEVADPDVPRPAGTMGTNLVQTGDGLAEIFTDLDGGEILLTLDVRDAPPATLDTGDWDAVLEASVTSTAGNLTVRPFPQGEPPSWCPSLAQRGPGSYRLRCHRKTSGDGGEEHLLSIWPTPHQPVTVHKQPATAAPLPMASLPTPQAPTPGRAQPGKIKR